MESSTPVAGPAIDTNGNRRRGVRHQLNIPATVVVRDETSVNAKAAPIAVLVSELSVGGIGIQSRVPLDEDAIYQINSFDTLIPPGTTIRIVSQRPAGEDGFEIGAIAL